MPDQPPTELIQLIGPYMAYALAGIFFLLGIAKMLAPRAFDALVERLRFRATERAKAAEHDRQDELALWTQMVNLQTQVISQNESLLGFVTQQLNGRLESLATETTQELRGIKTWWEKASREAMQSHNEMQLMRMEIARMADNIKAQEERVNSLVAYALAEERGHD